MTDPRPRPGDIFGVKYPFVLEDVELPPDEPGAVEFRTVKSWRPGVRFVMCAPDDTEAIADGLGVMLMTVISTHKPGRYPERIFYVRSWRSPEGKEFGKPKLHIVTAEKFRRLARDYQHDFRLLNTRSLEAAQ